MSVIKLQQVYADQILSMIERIDPLAIIAGGAPRDWYLGREATDLDVYFHPNPNWNVMTVRNQLVCAGFEFTDAANFLEQVDIESNECRSQYLANQYLKAVYNPANTKMKVQLMWMSEPTSESVLPQFTLNLSKAYYKNGKIGTDALFDLGVSKKAIIRTNSIYIDKDRYIDKIKAKFPDYTYYESENAYFGYTESIKGVLEKQKIVTVDTEETEDFELWANTFSLMLN